MSEENLGTYGPEWPKSVGLRSKRVHQRTFSAVGPQIGTFDPKNDPKMRGYIRPKIATFWDPTLIGGPVPRQHIILEQSVGLTGGASAYDRLSFISK